MRIPLFAAAAVLIAAPAFGGQQATIPTDPEFRQRADGSCRPDRPVDAGTEDGNPGYGATAGLNDDFHNDEEDPLDHPGQVIGRVTSEVAQGERDGGVHLLQDGVGNDCAKGAGE